MFFGFGPISMVYDSVRTPDQILRLLLEMEGLIYIGGSNECEAKISLCLAWSGVCSTFGMGGDGMGWGT